MFWNDKEVRPYNRGITKWQDPYKDRNYPSMGNLVVFIVGLLLIGFISMMTHAYIIN